ncbi:MAG: hypothetical protein JF924_00340 [Candidatus Dormibacteraeota bacterium]|nr:hypothetical protein [Candidatus Dormibacteraeota bacterium]
MDQELDKQALREALYEGFEPPSAELTESVLASVAAAPALPVLVAWLQTHWLALLATITTVSVAAAGAVAVILHQPPPPPPSVTVYAGYADTIHPGSQAPALPSPWDGSPGVTFEGSGPDFDAGSIRIENRSDRTLIVDRVTVDIGSQHFDLWGSGLRLQAHHSLILTQTTPTNFDSSEANLPNCQTPTEVPVIHVTIDGKTRDYRDFNRILSSGGHDASSCGGAENHPWERLSS